MRYILLLTICLLVFILYNKSSHSNNIYQNYYLNKDETYNIIKSHKKYYDTFYSNDYKVRNITSIYDYMEKIKDSCVSITEKEKEILEEAIQLADIKMKQNNFEWYNNMKAIKLRWKIGITVGNMYEGGYPHTINDTIILNRNIINNNLVRVLIHEKIHIYQKQFPEDVKKYLELNNFKVYKKREEIDDIRANPDIDQYIYIKGDIIYSAKYRMNPTSISDVQYNSQYYEHPFETMAIELSKF